MDFIKHGPGATFTMDCDGYVTAQHTTQIAALHEKLDAILAKLESVGTVGKAAGSKATGSKAPSRTRSTGRTTAARSTTTRGAGRSSASRNQSADTQSESSSSTSSGLGYGESVGENDGE